MEGRELRRSYTQMDFPVGRNKSDKQHQIRTSKRFAMPSSNRMKFPTLEIYRPPGQRIDNNDGSKLNVYAKEFVSLQTSRSTHNMLGSNNGDGLPRRPHSNNKTPTVGFPLHHSKSSHIPQQKNMSQNHSHAKVQWVMDTAGGEIGDKNNNRVGNKTELKRSKSMSSAHSSSSSSSSSSYASPTLQNSVGTSTLDLPSSPPTVPDLPPDVSLLVKASSRDPNECSCTEIIELAKKLVEKATQQRQYAEQLAACCATIIEKEERCTFLESLLNSCQYVLQKKHKDQSGSKYYAFMAFLSHLYTLMKRQPHDDKTDLIGIHPNTALLCLLVQCCQGSLKEPVLKLRQEIECLFFIVTTIGRELEQELPKQLDTLMNTVRDAFFNAETTDAIRKTLMQLIELHAARWQLPGYTVMYYQSSSSELP